MFSIDFVEYFSHKNLLERLALMNSIVTEKKKRIVTTQFLLHAVTPIIKVFLFFLYEDL